MKSNRKSATILCDHVQMIRYACLVVDPSAAKEVRTTNHDAAMVMIGIAMLMMAFTTLVIKIIEVARSK